MHICPHCGQPGIGILRKHFIGAAVPATCNNCGEKVFNENKKALIAVAPFIASYVGNIYINDNVLSYFLALP